MRDNIVNSMTMSFQHCAARQCTDGNKPHATRIS
jgi:hypothetical protein